MSQVITCSPLPSAPRSPQNGFQSYPGGMTHAFRVVFIGTDIAALTPGMNLAESKYNSHLLNMGNHTPWKPLPFCCQALPSQPAGRAVPGAARSAPSPNAGASHWPEGNARTCHMQNKDCRHFCFQLTESETKWELLFFFTPSLTACHSSPSWVRSFHMRAFNQED